MIEVKIEGEILSERVAPRLIIMLGRIAENLAEEPLELPLIGRIEWDDDYLEMRLEQADDE